MDDGAAVRIGNRWLVFTTDSHVIQPLFFPGGDIGRLSISGVVNDLAMMGATEVLGLSCSIVVEEGFPRADLTRILASMRQTCDEAKAAVLTGDTKVMGRGEIDGSSSIRQASPSPTASSLIAVCTRATALS